MKESADQLKQHGLAAAVVCDDAVVFAFGKVLGHIVKYLFPVERFLYILHADRDILGSFGVLIF